MTDEILDDIAAVAAEIAEADARMEALIMRALATCSYRQIARAAGFGNHHRVQLVVERQAEQTHVVYYISRSDGAIKIGTTKRIVERVRALRAIYEDLTLLAVEPGSFTVERERHEFFSDERIDGSEWFLPSERLHAFVTLLALRAA